MASVLEEELSREPHTIEYTLGSVSKNERGFLNLDTPSFMAPKVRQKARCHSCGVKGEQLRNQAPNQTCLQRRAGVRARGGYSGYGQPKGGQKGGLFPSIIIKC